MEYRADIDGLRAIAVLLVLLYHAELACPGGYVGVDVFFVISGYLIGRWITLRLAERRFSLRSFWLRRIRRLFPALAVMLGVVACVSWLVLTPSEYADFGLSLASQGVGAANLVFWRRIKEGYFGDLPESRPTLHTWSLAVEEQFYLLIPLVLMAVYPGRSRMRAPVLLLGLTLFSFFLSTTLTPIKPVLAYFLLPTRAFEILLGILVLYLPSRLPSRLASGLALIGAGAVLSSAWSLSEDSVFPGFLALWPCLGTALLIWAGPQTPLARLLGSPAPRQLGLLSYSLYLWHWPILALWRLNCGPWGLSSRASLLALSIGLGYLSWRWIERPIREKRFLRSDRSLLLTFGAASSGFATIGLCLWGSGGAPRRWTPKALAYLDAAGEQGSRKEITLEEIQGRRFLSFGSKKANAPRVFLWGDSHAMALQAGLDSLFQRYGIQGQAATASLSPPFELPIRSWSKDPQQPQRFRAVRDDLVDYPPDAVIVSCCWDLYTGEVCRKGLELWWKTMQRHKIPSFIVLQVPRQSCPVPRKLALLEMRGESVARWGLSPEAQRDQARPFLELLDSLSIPEAARIDLSPCLWNPGSRVYRTSWEDRAIYCDDNHLTPSGSRLVAPAFRQLAKKLAEN